MRALCLVLHRYPLKVSLEDLYKGIVKKVKLTRTIVDAASGRNMEVENVLEINVKAGWKPGTTVSMLVCFSA